MVLASAPSFGQLDPYDYDMTGSSLSNEFLSGFMDEELFYLPLDDGSDLFGRMSKFNFSAVRYRRRGYPERAERIYAGNIDLSGMHSKYTDYSLISNLRRIRARSYDTFGPGMTPLNFGSAGATGQYDIKAFTLNDTRRVSFSYSNRKSGYGLTFSGAEHFDRWSVGFAANLRTGRDADVKGVFQSEASLVVSAGYRISPGHSVNALMSSAISQKGGRSYSYEQVFDLTGDNLYNPSWGYYNGKVRNSKVSDNSRPFTMLSYEGAVSRTTNLTASVSYCFGKEAYSGLAWYRAAVPYPDYYQKLNYALLHDAWREGDVAVTQLNWDDMCEQNLGRGSAAYIIEQKVERISNLQAAVSAETAIDKQTKLVYGLRSRIETSSFCKEMKDLLGGGAIHDIDPYQLWSGEYPLNNMRDPNRLVNEGDKFGYDYDIRSVRNEAYAMANHSGRRFTLGGGVELGRTSMQRDGKYENQLYPGKQSFGKSAKHSFDTYSVKAYASYHPSPRHSVSVSGMVLSEAPFYRDIFVSPDCCDKTIDDAVCKETASAELSYAVSLERFSGKVTGYYTQTRHEASVSHYYDYLTRTYSDMLLSDIATVSSGVEVAVSCDISPRLTLSAIGAVGRSRYSGDADVAILANSTKNPYVVGAKSYLKDYRTGGSPEIVASAELKYNARGWIVSLTCNYMGERYLSPTALRRMERTYNLTGSAESFARMVGQQKLNDATTLDLFLLKSFSIAGQRFTATASVKNLLGTDDIIYNGYEQMRIAMQGSGVNRVYEPFANKYLYGFPRSYYLSLTYRF